MPEPGMVLGLVGRLVGKLFDLVGRRAVRREAHHQACFDQRRVEEQLKESISDLVPLLESARTSYERLAAAEGRLRSGAAVAWMSKWEQDIAEAKSADEESAVLGTDCSHLSPRALSEQRLKVDRLQRRLAALASYYQASLAEDRAGVERRRNAIDAALAERRPRRP